MPAQFHSMPRRNFPTVGVAGDIYFGNDDHFLAIAATDGHLIGMDGIILNGNTRSERARACRSNQSSY